MGIRLALGARHRDVFELVLSQGLRLTGTGIACGLLCSLVLTPLLRSQLYGVSPADLLTDMRVAGALTGVALVACLLSASRAADVDPIRVLRYE